MNINRMITGIEINTDRRFEQLLALKHRFLNEDEIHCVLTRYPSRPVAKAVLALIDKVREAETFGAEPIFAPDAYPPLNPAQVERATELADEMRARYGQRRSFVRIPAAPSRHLSRAAAGI